MNPSTGLNILRLTFAAHEFSLMLTMTPQMFEGRQFTQLTPDERVGVLNAVRGQILSIAHSVSTESLSMLEIGKIQPLAEPKEPLIIKPN